MKPPEDEVLLRDMLAHARLAVAAVADKKRRDLDSDFVLAAALERFIEVIGEAASKVSTATRARAPRIPWREIVGMRNRLVHGYSSVDHDIVWDVISADLVESSALSKTCSPTSRRPTSRATAVNKPAIEHRGSSRFDARALPPRSRPSDGAGEGLELPRFGGQLTVWDLHGWSCLAPLP